MREEARIVSGFIVDVNYESFHMKLQEKPIKSTL
jgi:hypothetical protein